MLSRPWLALVPISYNPLEDQDFATACVLCPLNSYTVETNSTSRAACVCDEGFYDANASNAIDQDLIDAMIEAGNDPINMTAAVVDCQVCPVGTDCQQGSTLEELPLVRGFYRVGNDNTDVRLCPDADSNCSTSFGTDACVSTSGCVGGRDSSTSGSLCAQGLEGTFCRTCTVDAGSAPVFYVQATAKREAYCKECGNTLPQTLGLGAAALVALGLAILGLMWLKRKPRFQYFMATFTPQNKLKILIVRALLCQSQAMTPCLLA